MMFKKVVTVLFLCFSLKLTAQNARILDSIVNTSKLSFQVIQNKPTGDGWAFLTKQFSLNNYVGWGEYHNSPLLSLLTQEALGVAAKNNYNAWVVEISPMAASALENFTVNKAAYQQYMAANEVYQGKNQKVFTFIPFFYSSADSLMLLSAVHNNIKLWGIDHESQTSFHLYINQAYHNLSKAAQVTCKNAYDSAMKYWYMPDAEDMDALIAASKNKKDIEALQEVKKAANIVSNNSRRKYRYKSLVDRTEVMRQHYYTYLQAFKTTYKKNPKVFFKMGDNHLAKGFNLEKQQLDVGNMVYELAKQEGVNFTNIAFMPRMSLGRDGKIIDALTDPDTEYSTFFLKQYNADKWVVIDLRPLRDFITQPDGSIDEKGYEIIRKYDVLVISPEVDQ